MFNTIKLSEKNTKKLLTILKNHVSIYKNKEVLDLYNVISYQVE